MADIPSAVSGVKRKIPPTRINSNSEENLPPPPKKPKVQNDDTLWTNILSDYPGIKPTTVPATLKREAITAAKAGVPFNIREALYGSPRGVDVTVTPIHSGFEDAMTDILRLIFDSTLLNKFTVTIDKAGEEKKTKTLRNIYELTSPATQCRAVIGPVDKTTDCWICGIPIQYGGVGVEPGICEHVLPIVQAVMFLGLYSQKRMDEEHAKGLEYNPRTDPALQLEYRYAHKICNRVKSDKVLIGTGQQKVWPHEYFGVITSSIKELLESIWSNGKNPSFQSALHASYGADKERFVTERMAAMESHLFKITDFLNSSSAPGLVKLRALANLISSPTHNRISLKGADISTSYKQLSSYLINDWYDNVIVNELLKSLRLRPQLEPSDKLVYDKSLIEQILYRVAKKEAETLKPFISTNAGQLSYSSSVKQALLRSMVEEARTRLILATTQKEKEIMMAIMRRIGIELVRKYKLVKDLPLPEPVPAPTPAPAPAPTPAPAALQIKKQFTLTPSSLVVPPLPIKSKVTEESSAAIGGAGTAIEPVEKDTVMDIIQAMILLQETAPEAVAAEEERIAAEELTAMKSSAINNVNFGAYMLNSMKKGPVNIAGGYRVTRKRRTVRRRRTIRR